MTSRRLTAAIAGVVAGMCAFLLLLLAGWLVYLRLWTGSGVVLVLLLVVFGMVGAYAGWLLGLVVFSSVRGAEAEGPEPAPGKTR
jgi:hypothetical protein